MGELLDRLRERAVELNDTEVPTVEELPRVIGALLNEVDGEPAADDSDVELPEADVVETTYVPAEPPAGAAAPAQPATGTATEVGQRSTDVPPFPPRPEPTA